LFVMDIGGIPKSLQDLGKARLIWSPCLHSMRADVIRALFWDVLGV
jgi:hypothetical protein